uniref:DNA/RNA non-specific endonuclease domain-containing protein n=1 Tax=Musca domestica TaxID=7370 RepID=A0A1I8NK60_MUSDO
MNKCSAHFQHCYITTNVCGYCTYYYSHYESKRPKLYRNLGDRKELIPIEGLEYRIEEGDLITADCETRIPSINQGKGKGSSINLTCFRRDLFADGTKLRTILQTYCEPIYWNLFESSRPFDWCPTPLTSYLLARPLYNLYEYLAGVCYDAERQQILTVLYAEAHLGSKHKYPASLQYYSPKVEILDVPTKFGTRRINATHFNNSEIREWMQFYQYENHSLIQDDILYRQFYDKFGGLLELDWWPNFRAGNWLLYEQALREHIEADGATYDIMAGASGTVAVPSHENASRRENYAMLNVIYGENQQIPLYVWHYLKSQNENGSDVVVIGVNSPFGDFYKETDLIFCTDICHQIDWLQAVQSTFRNESMGLIFCCDANEVKQSKRLHGFPLGSSKMCSVT